MVAPILAQSEMGNTLAFAPTPPPGKIEEVPAGTRASIMSSSESVAPMADLEKYADDPWAEAPMDGTASDNSITDKAGTTTDATATGADGTNIRSSEGTSTDGTPDGAQTMAGEVPAAPVAPLPTVPPTPKPTPRPFLLKLTSFQCDSAEVDVKVADKTLTCTVKAQASEGVSRISAAFYNAPLNKRILVRMDASDLLQGDLFSGTFVGDVTIPMASDQGMWSLGFTDTGAYYALEVLDVAGNKRSYTKDEAVAFFTELQRNLQINSYTGDLLAYPQANVVSSSGMDVRSIACLDISVKATTGDKQLTCTATVKPDEAGVGTVHAFFVSPTNRTIIPLMFAQNSMTQFLTAKNGDKVATLTTKITISQWSETGSYTMPYSGPFRVTSVSRAGTIRTFEAGMLASTPSLQVVAKGDAMAPLLTKFACQSGESIQLSNKGAVALTCSLKGYDDQAGVSYLAMQFVSPSRTQALEFSFVPESAGLGDFPNLVIPQVSVTQTVSLTNATEPGPWTLARAVAADLAGNYKAYNAAELDAKAVQTYLMVQGVTQRFSIAPRAGTDAPAKTVSPALPRPMPLLSVAVAASAGAMAAGAAFMQ